MKRWTVAALAAATLISATAIAETLAQVETTSGNHQTATRWSADEARTSGTVAEYVPSVNFALGGQAAFVLP